MEPCTEKHRIDRLEADVKELKEADKKHDDDITGLKEGQAEFRLFQKLIMESIQELKVMVAHKTDPQQQRVESSDSEPSSRKDWINLFKWLITGTIGIIIAKMFTS